MKRKITFLLSAAIMLLTMINLPFKVKATDFTLSSASSVTIDGITVSFAKASGSNAPAWYDAGLRLYASNTVTISSANNITAITFDWEKQGNKTFASATANVGSYTHPSAAGEGTWEGSATTVVFTLGNSGQLQLNTLHVTAGSTSISVTLDDINEVTLSGTNGSTAIAEGETKTYAQSGTVDFTAADLAEHKKFVWKVVKTGVTPVVDVTSTVLSSVTFTSAKLTVPSYNVTVKGTVETKSQYTLSYNNNNASATGSTTGGGIFDEGDEITAATNGFSLTGYRFTKWNTASNGSGNNYAAGETFNISANTELFAQWALLYSISTTITGDGSISVNSTAIENEDVSITISPNAGYSLSSLIIRKEGSGTVTPTISGNTATFKMPADNVTIEATFIPAISVDFENDLKYFGDWEFTYISRRTNNTKALITAHGGSSYGNNSNNGTNATSTASIKTRSRIKTPGTLTFYISKETTNTTSSTWKIQTSENGTAWTDRGSIDAHTASMNEGATWLKSTTDLSSYSNVYVRIYYSNSNSLRAIDDISLTYTPAPQILSVNNVDNITIKADAGSINVLEGKNATISELTKISLSCTDHENGYRLGDWSVYKTGDPTTTVTVTDNSFEMPAYPVTVSATVVPTHTVTYSINGVTNNVVIDDGDDVNPLPAPAAASIPEGYEFLGWTNNEDELDNEDFVTSYTEDDDITFYAVFKKTNNVTLLPSDFGTYANEATKKLHGIEFTYAQVGTYSSKIQFKSGSGYLFNTEAFSNLQSIVVTRTDANLVTVKAGNTSANPSSESAIEPSSTTNPSSGIYIDTYNGVANKKYILLTQSSCVPKCTKIVFVFSSLSDTRYTRVVSETISEDITISEPTYIATGSIVNAGNHLTCNNPANLIIEDGGQLIVTNSGVQATFKKKITPTTSKVTDNTHWYTISSPVGTINIAGENCVNNLVNNDVSYNLYRLSTTADKWEAYKPSAFTTLDAGRGYLYRNDGSELSFPGEIGVSNVTTFSLTTSYNDGFNLIGNPFSHSIYKGNGGAINSSKLNDGFYYLTDKGAWQAGTYKTEIKPLMGILVQANDEGTITITKTASYATAEKYANDELMFMVSNNQYEDVAYAMFHKGSGLNKIEHRNSDIPMLYINHDNNNYAIAMMSDDTKSFNLNFKAKKTGQYKLTYKAEGEFSYLHVIDRLTGADVDMLIEGEYNFIGTPHDNENRFIVSLGYLPDYGEGNNDIFAFQNGSDILVSGQGELQIFDVTGRMVKNTIINGAETINVQTQGVYILRLVGNDVKTQKIVVR